MNKTEFKKVMDIKGIKNPLSMYSKNGSKNKTDIYIWNNLAIYQDSYYATVHGNIPLEVANKLYKKYPNNPYGIRVEGGTYDKDPQECAGKGYISCYHIDTMEGLIIFLTEMQAYILDETDDLVIEDTYSDLISQAISENLKDVNPSISAYDWMQEIKGKDTYNAAIERDKKNELWSWLRNLISEFDMAVNPYINNNIELDNVNNYLENVSVEIGKLEDNDCRLIITDSNSENKTIYIRHSNGFLFQLECEKMSVSHLFFSDDSKIGEEIKIWNYSGDNLVLNLITRKAGEEYNEKQDVQLEQLGYIADELGKAIKIAKEVTVKNMSKKENTFVK